MSAQDLINASPPDTLLACRERLDSARRMLESILVLGRASPYRMDPESLRAEIASLEATEGRFTSGWIPGTGVDEEEESD